MKRYNLQVPTLDELEEDPNGEWVKWESHKDEFFRFTEIYEKRISTLKEEINQLKTITGTGAESPSGMIMKGEDMQRYNLEETGVPYEMSDRVLVEHPDGEWVKWKDIEPYLDAIESEKARIRMIDRRIDRIIKEKI